MRKPVLLLAAIAALAAAFPRTPATRASAAATRQEAFRGVRQGDILPLNVIRDRVRRIPGAQLIGADLIAAAPSTACASCAAPT